MKKRTHGCYSGELEMNNSIDHSLLRTPLTPFTGFQEARSAFDKGSAEVRQLLLYECSLIYECNVCRNMFRSLANFISHKRIFCCRSFNKYPGPHSSHGADGKGVGKSDQREFIQPKLEPHLQENSVFTYKAKRLARSSIERDGRAVYDPLNENKDSQHEQKCRDENTQETEQQLQSSNPSNQYPMPTYVFQCPSCSLTFLKSSSVIRHLAAAHNIPIRRIRMMRDSLLKHPATPSVKEDCCEVKNTPDNISVDNSDKSNTEKEKLILRCGFCQKIFEQRSSLSTHLQTCRIRMDMLEPHSSPTTNSRPLKLQVNTETIAALKPAVAADVDSQFDENVEDVKQTFAELENQSFGTGLQTVSLDKLDILASESTNESIFETPVAIKDELPNSPDPKMSEDNTIIPIASSNVTTSTTTLLARKKQRKMRSSTVAKQSCRCKICGKPFNALSNLRRHISMFHYRARKFGCALCDYCAFRRYDIINHLSFVHKLSGERESMSTEYVRVNDVPYTKEDMDEDIVICSDDDDIKANAEANNSSSSFEELTISKDEYTPEALEYEQKSNDNPSKSSVSLDESIANDIHSNENKEDALVEIKSTRQKLKRSFSHTSSTVAEDTHATKLTQKRSTRNRTKPINKDFVYDMKDVMQKGLTQTNASSEVTETYHLRGSKRRNTLLAHVEFPCPPVAAFDALKAKNYAAIKGTVRRACLLLVNQGLAASSTLPEIPTERPQMRPRVTSVQRSDLHTGTVIETSELEANHNKSLPLCDDSYLEKIAKESVGTFEIKPCLAQQQHTSALDTLLQKVDFTMQLHSSARTFASTTSKTAHIFRDEGMQLTDLNFPLIEAGSVAITSSLQCYTTPEQPIPKALTTPPLKPQKRLSSLDRLTEALETYYRPTLNE